MNLFITQSRLAAEAGVSRSTVQAVLSGAPNRISVPVRERVLAAASRFNYQPNRFAQAMRKGKSGLIGIVNFGAIYELSERKVLAASEAIIQKGYEPLVQESLWFSQKNSDVSQEACRRMLESRVEGVLLVNPGVSFQQKHVDQLVKAGVSVVASGVCEFLQGVPNFVSDREWGYEQIARHLFGLGHRRLTLIAEPQSDVERAIVRIAEQFDVNAAPQICWPDLDMSIRRESLGMPNFRLGKKAMSQILAGGERPDAVICSNDEVAQGALTACAENGVSVPDGLALTGFDDFFGSEYGFVPLTTLTHPISEISEQAVGCLLDMIQSGRQPESQTVRIRGRLTVRRSCGAFRKNLPTAP